MWYQLLFHHLAERYLDDDQSIADGKRFADRLMAFSKFMHLLSLEGLLGMHDKLFTFLQAQETGSITLERFAQRLFGFWIIYSKQADDDDIWLDDFQSPLQDPVISKALCLGKHRGRLYRKAITDIAHLGIGLEALSDDQLVQIMERTSTLFLQQMEREALLDINHKLTLRYSNLKRLFNTVDNRNILTGFCREARESGGETDEMLNLIKHAGRLTRQGFICVGHTRTSVPRRLLNAVERDSGSKEKKRFLAGVNQLEPMLRYLGRCLDTNEDLADQYDMACYLEMNMLYLLLKYIGREMDDRHFLKRTSQVLQVAKQGLPDRAWQEHIDELAMACTACVTSGRSTSRYISGDLHFFARKEVVDDAPVTATSDDDPRELLTQSR